MVRSSKWCPQRHGHVWSYRQSRCTQSAMWRCAVESLGTVAVSGEWSIMLAPYCSRTVAVCLHALQVLTVLPARTSGRPCQAPWKFARMRWEHACLFAQAGLLDFSLCLRPTLAGRRGPEP
jgi:hypothetical protein